MKIFLNSCAHFFAPPMRQGRGSGNFDICHGAPEC